MPSKQALQQKTEEVEEITNLIKGYSIIGIASLQKVRAAQLQEFKRNLADKVYMRVLKNTLIKLAIENCKERPDLKKLEEHVKGSNVFMFTNLNPFKLSLILAGGKVKTTAKSGDVAAFDVVVPAGNTGQPPGPIISQLNAVGLPTRIESGSVWINKDTLVVRKGEQINERLASILSKLGIKPVETGLALTVAFDDGLIVTQEQLKLDIDGIKHEVESAYAESFALSLGISYPTKENMVTLLQLAHREAYALSVGAAIPTKETIEDLLRKANAQMLSLDSKVTH
ncbi:MAG TPA: 50S ribosomal protein L10 [Candidatus Acidoferrales bacterium]|nr:50S ribosomal protein L10 [Candidatus Acidoferrales bacterium]